MDEHQLASLMLRNGISRYEVTGKQYGLCLTHGLLMLVVVKEDKHIRDHRPFNEIGFGIVFRYEEQ